jgi:hypothetical protein
MVILSFNRNWGSLVPLTHTGKMRPVESFRASRRVGRRWREPGDKKPFSPRQIQMGGGGKSSGASNTMTRKNAFIEPQHFQQHLKAEPQAIA